MKKVIYVAVALALAGCTQNDTGVRVSSAQPVKKPVAPKQISRSEPVFYNGKTYQVDLTPDASGVYAIRVGGMGEKQKADAVAVATSSVRYFGCPDGKTGKLTNSPSYSDGNWSMSARCG